MRTKTHWMVRLVQIVSLLFVLLSALMVFVYTPWYSKTIVYILNRFVAVELNEVAAESQRAAKLTEMAYLEPGSEQWIAQQAYLNVLQESIESNSQEVVSVAARYRQLQKLLETQEKEKAMATAAVPMELPLNVDPLISETSAAKTQAEILEDMIKLNQAEHQQLKEKYIVFLKTYPLPAQEVVDITPEDVSNDLALLETVQENEAVVEKAKPNAIVVLGGGLTLDREEKSIIINDYTRLRLEKVLELKKQHDLPIVLSGVEAPYMQNWLKAHQVEAKLLEDRSMNTCENTRFSSLLLQKQGGAPTVYLVTDRYHLPRTRRLFALNGIQTIPVEAPMPVALTDWAPSQQNYDHSRRANYELLATLRDIWFGSSDCREVP